jgi:hypothetical protein
MGGCDGGEEVALAMRAIVKIPTDRTVESNNDALFILVHRFHQIHSTVTR